MNKIRECIFLQTVTQNSRFYFAFINKSFGFLYLCCEIRMKTQCIWMSCILLNIHECFVSFKKIKHSKTQESLIKAWDEFYRWTSSEFDFICWCSRLWNFLICSSLLTFSQRVQQSNEVKRDNRKTFSGTRSRNPYNILGLGFLS